MTHRADRTQEAAGFPAVVLIDNCNACNLRCSMCDHPNMTKHRKVQIMDFGLYRKVIDEVALENPSARVWQIFFGDPFMCRDMPERIRYAKQKGLTDVVLNTNGVLMKPEKARAVIEAGLDAMYVGIDAAKPDTYKRIRVGGKYETAVANVLAYRDILKQIGRPGQKLFVQFVVSDINEDQVDDFKAFWNSVGVNVKIRPKVSWAGLVSADNLRENEQVGRRPCYWLMRTINICADGRAALCSVDVHCRVPCGDVNTSSIKELWGGMLSEYRRMHLQGRFDELPPMCRDCRDWQSGYADFALADAAKQG
ncbi:radical SAM/SPASM domain-containing protein [Fundidesulfovibrio agrisoli]|uniref:radical SAM/SPASM domain-containing protein n=1 Tax=Fundidesulfovibrio agrisoli TaxID=2922717 RepID=UPI001FAD7A07|nr:radical SAM/SPASM domain-containing protein [Fundidesulfovibrio agrisoli]